ncbi:glycosyltransferase family 4 protein [uncultured Porphyromonas sp.]|uniref:glycosyltransferase family 4 protein n=1 Tax=uncultured Porphyromonas sp. TaxID=159274 RepID=UPI0025899D74|nr:glycosyltransferase family 4 protein [uncultured Porphyromonas sp.]
MSKKILLLTLNDIEDIEQVGIYTDLLRQLRDMGHHIYVVRPIERREKGKTELIERNGATILKVRTLNITRCNFIEKGISTLSIESLFIQAIKHYLKDIRFDLVLYSTPPITFSGVVSFLKKRDGSKSFLLLKDIFPQKAVDMKLLRSGGILHKFFRRKEKELYDISDFIGCMSPANSNYILEHNHIDPQKVTISPNSIDISRVDTSHFDKQQLKRLFKLPDNKLIFIYGGNLGIPQGINNLIWLINKTRQDSRIFFVIAGSGTYYDKLKTECEGKENVKLFQYLPREEYDQLVKCADIGMIFLSQYFEIPNFPSRLIAYMSAKLPIFCITDKATDIGRIATNNGFGYAVELNKSPLTNQRAVQSQILSTIDEIVTNKEKLPVMGKLGYEFMEQNYSAKKQAEDIILALR